MKEPLTDERGLAPTPAEAMPVGALVHQVANAIAAIKFSAGGLRAAGTLTEPALAELTRIEAAAALVVRTVKSFASAGERVPVAPPENQILDLYDVCCELAERWRITEGRAVYCRAFGDCRGPWDRKEMVPFIAGLVRVAVRCLAPVGMLNVALTGLGRHVRLDLHGLGSMTVDEQQECLAIASRNDTPRGAMLTMKVTRAAGTTLSLRLAR